MPQRFDKTTPEMPHGPEDHDIRRYRPEGPGAEGSVMHATIELAGQRFICIDSAVKHPFTFTPAISRYVNYVGN